MSEKPKHGWRYKFANYKRAFILLREAIEIRRERALTALEREGIARRFEYTWELAWKTAKAYLEHEGIAVSPATPRAVIRAALQAELIADGEAWMAALDDRNKMAHTYNFEVFAEIVDAIESRYLALFDRLHERPPAEEIKDD